MTRYAMRRVIYFYLSDTEKIKLRLGSLLSSFYGRFTDAPLV